jgi:hypothetical protein
MGSRTNSKRNNNAALQGVVLYQQISSSSDEAIKAALGLVDEADKASRFPFCAR